LPLDRGVAEYLAGVAEYLAMGENYDGLSERRGDHRCAGRGGLANELLHESSRTLADPTPIVVS